MNLYFDNIIFALQKAGGVSVVWFELLKRFQNDSNFNLSFLDYGEGYNYFRNQLLIGENQKIDDFVLKIPVILGRYINPLCKVHSGIFHSSYYRTIDHVEIKNVTTVHDFTYEYYRKGLSKAVHFHQKRNAIFKSDKIICVSESTKSDLFHFFPEVDKSKVCVIHNGVNSEYKVLSNSINNLKQLISFSSMEYALYVGDRKSLHKNFQMAVNSCSKSKTPLVLVGGGTITNAESIFLKQSLTSYYIHLGNLENSELNLIYNHALCLLYPSSYEGFGIPVIEAQKAGCPIIAGYNSSIPEIAGDSCPLIVNINSDKISDMINILKNDLYFKNKLVEEGLQNSKRFSWDKCFFETKLVYEELFNV